MQSLHGYGPGRRAAVHRLAHGPGPLAPLLARRLPLSARTAGLAITLSARLWKSSRGRNTMKRSPAVQNLIAGRDVTGPSAFTAGA